MQTPCFPQLTLCQGVGSEITRKMKMLLVFEWYLFSWFEVLNTKPIFLDSFTNAASKLLDRFDTDAGDDRLNTDAGDAKRPKLNYWIIRLSKEHRKHKSKFRVPFKLKLMFYGFSVVAHSKICFIFLVVFVAWVRCCAETYILHYILIIRWRRCSEEAQVIFCKY